MDEAAEIPNQAENKTPLPNSEFREGRNITDIETKVRMTFPFLTNIDRSEYDSYDPAIDKLSAGQLLKFSGERIDDPKNPTAMFIFRPSGFVINYYNAPESNIPNAIRNTGNSLYGPKERRWRDDEVELALEKAKIHMDGIDITNEDFLNQPASWSDIEQRFLTMGEIMESWERFKNEPKNFKDKAKRMQTSIHKSVFTLLEEDPEKARELAVARILKTPTYTTFDGQTSPTEVMIEHIRQGDPIGERATIREMNRIEAEQTLLRDHGLFPRV